MPTLIPIPADDEDEHKGTYVVLPNAEGDPKTVVQAQSHPDWPDWKAVMDHKIKSLEEAGTWDTVQRPCNKNIVSCKWVLRAKRTAEGALDKHCYAPWTICVVLYLYSHTMCTTGLFLPDSDCLIGLTRYLDT